MGGVRISFDLNRVTALLIKRPAASVRDERMEEPALGLLGTLALRCMLLDGLDRRTRFSWSGSMAFERL
jgi:hypothetical protein